MNAIGSKLRRLEGGYVAFVCPGCGRRHKLRVDGDGSPRWSFNGDLDRPTFTPSILARREEWTPPVMGENLAEWKRAPWPQTKVMTICHSFVTDGRIQFLSDCTHALAGQTVDLPYWEGVS